MFLVASRRFRRLAGAPETLYRRVWERPDASDTARSLQTFQVSLWVPSDVWVVYPPGIDRRFDALLGGSGRHSRLSGRLKPSIREPPVGTVGRLAEAVGEGGTWCGRGDVHAQVHSKKVLCRSEWFPQQL